MTKKVLLFAFLILGFSAIAQKRKANHRYCPQGLHRVGGLSIKAKLSAGSPILKCLDMFD